jgi:hypothetical protein
MFTRNGGIHASQTFAHLCISGYLVSSNNSDFCWQGSRWRASRSRPSPSWSLAGSWGMGRLGMGLVGGSPGHWHRRRYSSSPPMLVSVLWLLPLPLPLRLGLLDSQLPATSSFSSERVGASCRVAFEHHWTREMLLRPWLRELEGHIPHFKADWRSNPNSPLIPSNSARSWEMPLNDRAIFMKGRLPRRSPRGTTPRLLRFWEDEAATSQKVILPGPLLNLVGENDQRWRLRA